VTEFDQAPKGVSCEFHLLVDSRKNMFPTDVGYCAKRARWWYGIFMLCDEHRRRVEDVVEAAR